jgi:nucleotide-binding universal stress UspA family protein
VARSHGGTVTALHVFPVPGAVPVAVPFGPEGPGPFALNDLDRESTVQQMKKFLAVDDSLGARVEFLVAEAPSVYREILAQADRRKADLIVMGTHGRSGVERLLLGSTTDKLLRRATMPVMTVPAEAPDVVPMQSFQRIVCAVDFSPCSLAALESASSLARETDSRLTVLHVIELLPVVYEPSMATPFDFERDRPMLEQAGRDHLHRFIPDLVARQSAIDEVVTSGKPYVEILKEAAERRADLIVLGVHGHNVLDRLLFGSTAGHVVRGAGCPVLTVGQRDIGGSTASRPA